MEKTWPRTHCARALSREMGKYTRGSLEEPGSVSENVARAGLEDWRVIPPGMADGDRGHCRRGSSSSSSRRCSGGQMSVCLERTGSSVAGEEVIGPWW